MTGAQLIAAERTRQITKEGYSANHDDGHADGSLAMAAACYAAPDRIYIEDRLHVNRVSYVEPWPWEARYDKRYSMGERARNPGNSLPLPHTISTSERVDLLIKAGALIAAELDRLQRAHGPVST